MNDANIFDLIMEAEMSSIYFFIKKDAYGQA